MEDDTGMSNDTIIRPKCDYKVTRRGHRNSIMIHVERIERMSAELGGDVAWAFRISPSGSTYGQRQIPYFMRDFVGVEGVDREALDAARCARDERRQMEKLLKIAPRQPGGGPVVPSLRGPGHEGANPAVIAADQARYER